MDSKAAIGIEVSDLDLYVAVNGAQGVALLKTDSGLPASAASAFLNGRQWVVGNQARQQSVQLPHLCIDGFWESINMDPVDVGGKKPLRAELANLHLEAVLQQSGVVAGRAVVAVPGTFRGVAGLLSGLVNDNGLECVALLDAAIASLLASPDVALKAKNVVVVDVSLRSTALTVLSLADGIERQQVRLLEKTGWEQFHRGLVRWLRNESVRRTRYDPLHDAAGEQDLVNQLYTVLQTADDRSPETVDFTGSGAMTVARSDFEVHCRDGVTAIADGLKGLLDGLAGDVAVLLNHRAARVPGIAAALSGLGIAAHECMEPGSAAVGSVEFMALLDEFGEAPGECRFITRLGGRFLRPGTASEGTDDAATEATEPGVMVDGVTAPEPDGGSPAMPSDSDDGQHAVTHMLFRGEVFPLRQPTMVIGRDSEAQITVADDCAGVSRRHCEVVWTNGKWVLHDVSRHGTLLDGEPLTGPQPLRVGAILSLGSNSIQLMAVRVRE